MLCRSLGQRLVYLSRKIDLEVISFPLLHKGILQFARILLRLRSDLSQPALLSTHQNYKFHFPRIYGLN